MIRTMLAALAVLFVAAACSPEVSVPHADHGASAETSAPAGDRDKVGRIYHYVRSNIGGGEEEEVYVFRKGVDFLEVYKMRSRCTNAALVTAEMDMEEGYATKLTGGRLLPGAEHHEFAFLTYDPAERVINARIEIPDQTLAQELAVLHEPWHLYDFDFASLTVMTPRLSPHENFSFGLPVVIADPGRAEFLTWLGQAEATFAGEETRDGKAAWRYALGGSAFPTPGNLWIDAEDGHILDVETDVPNHLEYRDFKLKLVGIDDGGEEAWTKLLAAHFEGC